MARVLLKKHLEKIPPRLAEQPATISVVCSVHHHIFCTIQLYLFLLLQTT